VSVAGSLSYNTDRSWALVGADIGVETNSLGELKDMLEKERRSGDGGTESPSVPPN